jgi:hypothetical protein
MHRRERGEAERSAVSGDSVRRTRRTDPAGEALEASASLHPLALLLRSAVSLALASGLDPEEVGGILSEVEEWLQRQSRSRVADRSVGILHAASELTQYWCTESEFLDDNGRPRILPMKGKKGSFSALVRGTGTFKTASGGLEALVRHGAAESDGKVVKLLSRTVIANSATPEARARAWMSSVAHLNTLIFNFADRPKAEKKPERTAVNLRFPVSAIPALRDTAEAHGEAFLVFLDQYMKEHEDRAAERGEPTQGVGVGFWQFDLPTLHADRYVPAPRRVKTRRAKQR